MASLSHSQMPDYPNKRSCKEANSPILYSSSNSMQDLYAFMQTLQHPQLQTTPYIQHAKPFYYSSNVQGLNKGTGEEEPFGSATTCSYGQASLRPLHLMEAMESKAGEHLNVNAAKKRIRAVMDHKDVEADGSMNRMKSIHNAEDSVVREKELPTEVKSSSSCAQKAKRSTFSKLDNTESNSSGTKPTGKAQATPTMDASSPATSKPDFIHVRARRGQATDSHSLAERVRREKISERMKYLQDLVPGCVKVSGKAMMLDEIINYVQALQRQVEFLSMKLAAIHPSKLEFSLENLFGKKVAQPSNGKDGSILEHAAAMQAFVPSADYQGNISSGFAVRSTEMFVGPHEVDANMLQSENQLSCNPAEFLANFPSALEVDDDVFMQRTAAANSGTPSATKAMLDSAYHSCISQNSQSELDWDDDLQNIVQQMGCFSQTSSIFPSHPLPEGLFLQNHMKPEL